MEFLKNKWTYLLLAAALALMIGASFYLYMVCRDREPYAGGMLVQAEQALPARIRTMAENGAGGEMISL